MTTYVKREYSNCKEIAQAGVYNPPPFLFLWYHEASMSSVFTVQILISSDIRFVHQMRQGLFHFVAQG